MAFHTHRLRTLELILLAKHPPTTWRGSLIFKYLFLSLNKKPGLLEALPVEVPEAVAPAVPRGDGPRVLRESADEEPRSKRLRATQDARLAVPRCLSAFFPFPLYGEG